MWICLWVLGFLAAPARPADLVLENARVRVWRAGAVRTATDSPPAVVVPIEDAGTRRAGEAYWAAAGAAGQGGEGPRVIVEPREATSRAAAASPAKTATKPGEQPFTGMSFRPIFENERVAVIRARMEVGAAEGFHTHASDVVIIHLSGGTIEDTADGRSVMKRWKHGDVEFEARGSSHSARNLGGAVDVVLVTLKP